MATIEKDGYEVLEDTTVAGDYAKAMRRKKLIISSAENAVEWAFNPIGTENDRMGGIPCDCDGE